MVDNKDLQDAKDGLKEVSDILNNHDNFQELVGFMYNEYDANKDGQIDMNEVKNLIEFINEDMAKSTKIVKYKKLNAEEIIQFAKEIDTNQNNIIDKDEFEVLIRKMLTKQMELYKAEIQKLQA